MIYRFQRTLSYRLLAWSALSILTAIAIGLQGAALSPMATGIALQFAAWGLIDAIIAGFGLRGLESKIQQIPDPIQVEHDILKLRRLLWINTGLDVVYVAGGLALFLLLGAGDDFARGNGLGVIIQGGFLLVFDFLHGLSIPRDAVLPHMPQFDQPDHQPFDLPGERGTVILVHGFPGTPVEMRALGEALNRSGWRVRGLLLPGFGAQIEHLFQQRVSGWVAPIIRALDEARETTSGPVILAGFSMGGGLSAVAAAHTQPDALILISPFWFGLPTHLRFLIRLAGIFFPEHFNPFRLLPAERMQKSQYIHLPPGDLYPPAPELFGGMPRDLRIPLVFLEQFVELSRHVMESVSKIACPVLMIQGNRDPIVRPEMTRRLATRLKTPYRLVEIEGEHHITIPGAAGFPMTRQAVVDYCEEFN